jgi:hypothetical protein
MSGLKSANFFFILILFSFAGFSQPINPCIDSLIHLISVETYRSHFDSLRTNKGCNRKVTGSKVQSFDHNSCRDYIFRTFKKYLGEGNVNLHQFEVGENCGLANVVAFKQGKSPTGRILVLSAHYDSNCSREWGRVDSVCSPGANDNGTGVAAVIEIARVLSGIETENSIIFAAWDFEEQFTDGFASGSNSWFNDFVVSKKKRKMTKKGDRVKIGIEKLIANINFDMFGNPNDTIDGKPVLWACSGNVTHSDFIKNYVATLKRYIPQITTVDRGKMTYSDHYTFAARKIPSVENLESGYNKDPFYHTCSDNLENSDNIDFNFAVNVTRGGMAYALEKAGLFVPANRSVIADAFPVMVYERPEAYTLKFNNDDYTIIVTNQFGNKINTMKMGDVCFIYPRERGLYHLTVFSRNARLSQILLLQKKEGDTVPFF